MSTITDLLKTCTRAGLLCVLVYSTAQAEEPQGGVDSGQDDSYKSRLLQLQTCRNAFDERADQLLLLSGKMPTHFGERVTPGMLHLNRKPTQSEKKAFKAYSQAVLACAGTDKPTSGWNLWSTTMLGDLLPLVNGEITYAQFNAVRKERADKAEKDGKEAADRVLASSQSDTSKQYQAQLDAWYKDSHSWCGTDKDCNELARKSYDDGSACNNGNTDACNRLAQNQANIDKWHADHVSASTDKKGSAGNTSEKTSHADRYRQMRADALSRMPDGSAPPAWEAFFSYAIMQGERFDKGEISAAEEKYLIDQKFQDTNAREDARIQALTPKVLPVPVPTPSPAYQAPRVVPQTDFTCMRDCRNNGYMYELCMRRCSY